MVKITSVVWACSLLLADPVLGGMMMLIRQTLQINDLMCFSPEQVKTDVAYFYEWSRSLTATELALLMGLLDPVREEVIYQRNKRAAGSKVFTATTLFIMKDDSKPRSDAIKVKFPDPRESLPKINGWVATQTKGDIPKFLDKVNPQTKLMKISVITYNAQFSLSPTVQKFYRTFDDSVKIPMMSGQASFKFKLITKLRSHLIALDMSPYIFNILLPLERDGIHFLINNLHKISVGDLSINMLPASGKLVLPVFKTKSKVDMKPPLQTMDIDKLFDNAKLADFLAKYTKVDDMLQAAVMNVAPGGGGGGGGGGGKKMDFTADHPFVYLLREGDKIHLAGRMTVALPSI